MAGVTAAALNKAMKEHYLPRIRGNLKRSNLFLKLCQGSEKLTMTGKSLIIKHRVSRTSGIVMNSSAGGSFPAPTESTWAETVIPWVEMLGTIGISDRDMLRAKKEAYSLVEPLTNEARDLTYKMKQMVNHNFLNGDSLGTVASYTDDTPDVVVCNEPIYHLIEKGMLLDIYDSGTLRTDCGDLTVLAVTGEKTFTVTSITGTPADGDTIHLADSEGNGAQSLADIISTTSTLQGVAGTSGYWWQANDAGVSSAADFSPRVLRLLITKIVKRLEDRRDGLHIIADAETFDVMAWVLLGQRQFQNTKKFAAYWDTIDYGGIPILKEYNAPAGTLYIVDKQGLIYGLLGGNVVNLVDGDGSSKRLQISSSKWQNSWNMHFTSYAQLGCSLRVGHGKYENINNLEDGSYPDLGGLAA